MYLEVSCRLGTKLLWIKHDRICIFLTVSCKCHTCGSKAASVSGDVIGKYNWPHTGLSWSTFTHQQHLQKEQTVISAPHSRVDSRNHLFNYTLSIVVKLNGFMDTVMFDTVAITTWLVIRGPSTKGAGTLLYFYWFSSYY